MVSSVSWMNVYSCSFRSEEHTSELQSQSNLVCRLLLEKKKNTASHVHDRGQQLPTDFTMTSGRSSTDSARIEPARRNQDPNARHPVTIGVVMRHRRDSA